MELLPSAVFVSAASGVFALSPGRAAAIVAGLAGLVGLVMAVRALARGADRSGRTQGTRRGARARNTQRSAFTPLVLGPIAMILGGWVVVTADGGLGTGNGLGGGVVAMVVGLAGTSLAMLALARSRRTG